MSQKILKPYRHDNGDILDKVFSIRWINLPALPDIISLLPTAADSDKDNLNSYEITSKLFTKRKTSHHQLIFGFAADGIC